MYGYHTDTLYELRPTSCTDVLRRCVRIAPTYASNNTFHSKPNLIIYGHYIVHNLCHDVIIQLSKEDLMKKLEQFVAGMDKFYMVLPCIMVLWMMAR